mgnify:CR=1 FL=1
MVGGMIGLSKDKVGDVIEGEIKNITEFGIFVIEMKNYYGLITGDEYKDKWTQYLGRNKYYFKNPIHQNYGHVKCLEEVLKLDFDNFLVGHGARMFPRQKMIDFYEVAKNINLEESVKVTFPNFDNANSYCYTKGVMYNQDHCGIVFDPNKL